MTSCLPAAPTPPPAPPLPAPEDVDLPAPDPCGGYSFAGACEGDVLEYCSFGTLVSVDCRTVDEDVTFTCAEIDSSYGFDCAAPPEAPCLDEVHGPAFCAGEQGACVRTPEGARCDVGYEACSALDERRCRGDQLIVECNVVQPHVLDCPSFGAVCVGGACSGIAEGEACDPALLRCDDGLACEDGVCVMAPVDLDAGARPDEGADASLLNDGGPLG